MRHLSDAGRHSREQHPQPSSHHTDRACFRAPTSLFYAEAPLTHLLSADFIDTHPHGHWHPKYYNHCNRDADDTNSDPGNSNPHDLLHAHPHHYHNAATNGFSHGAAAHDSGSDGDSHGEFQSAGGMDPQLEFFPQPALVHWWGVGVVGQEFHASAPRRLRSP